MYAITLHRPWATLIMKHGKDIENRSWKPPASLIGHRLAIHAGKQIDGAGIVRAMEILRNGAVAYAHDAQALCGEPGVIVGTVAVRGWVKVGSNDVYWLDASEVALANASPWLSGPYGWVLADPRPLREPIPCKGHQRLWVVPGALEEEIRGQL